VFGGGYGEGAVIYGSPTVNINQTYPLKFKSYTEGTTIYEVRAETLGEIGADGVFGGGNQAKIVGNTTINIGTEPMVNWTVLKLKGDGDPVLDDDGKVIPDSELYPDADGSEEPDENGWFDYYELCRSTTPCALQVVEDLIPDTIYDTHKMIRKKKVIKDIPNVTVGDFVIYRTAAVHNNPEAVDDDSNDEGCPVSTGDDEEPVVIDITDTDL
jgi:hypothetical protein